MKWEQYRSVMERYAIKTDDMATEDAYFMSTHMPFSSLELFRGGYYEEGKMPAPTKLMSEDEVFEQLIYNPDNEHRMIIVRGNHGTGKSHLIRYLKGRFERSPSTVYNPATEQLVFLRRLNNSVRGAFSQLLEQEAIKDPDIAEKLRKFVASSDSKDEDSFKTEILYAYIAAVRNDVSGENYKSNQRNIFDFIWTNFMNKEFDLKQSTKEVFTGLFGIGTVNKTVVVPLKATISLSEVPTVTVGLPVPIPGDFVTELKHRKHPCFFFIILNHGRHRLILCNHRANPTTKTAVAAAGGRGINDKGTFTVSRCAAIHGQKILV